MVIAEAPAKKTLLKITGMTCASCVKRVEDALRGVKGVTEANVNLANEKASVTYDPSLASVEDMIRAVKDAGYGVMTETVTLPVQGMTCASCVRRIEDALREKTAWSTYRLTWPPSASPSSTAPPR